jgi:hypothetical protein
VRVSASAADLGVPKMCSACSQRCAVGRALSAHSASPCVPTSTRRARAILRSKPAMTRQWPRRTADRASGSFRCRRARGHCATISVELTDNRQAEPVVLGGVAGAAEAGAGLPPSFSQSRRSALCAWFSWWRLRDGRNAKAALAQAADNRAESV